MPTTNPRIKTEFDMPNPNESPLNLIQLFSLANKLVHSEIIEATYMPYVVGGSTPDVDDQDKLWLELDSQQRPIALKFFFGSKWRRVYNGMIGEIRGFSGDPGGRDNDKTSNFDSQGRGSVEGLYDGWHLCNGKNGTPDLSDKFLVGAHMNNADSHNGWDDGEWQTWVDTKDGRHTGGSHEFTLNKNNTYFPGIGDLWAGRWAADTNARSDDGQLYGIPKHNDSGVLIEVDPPNRHLLAADKGNTEPDPVSKLPPFLAVAWIIFIGYSTTT